MCFSTLSLSVRSHQDCRIYSVRCCRLNFGIIFTALTHVHSSEGLQNKFDSVWEYNFHHLLSIGPWKYWLVLLLKLKEVSSPWKWSFSMVGKYNVEQTLSWILMWWHFFCSVALCCLLWVFIHSLLKIMNYRAKVGRLSSINRLVVRATKHQNSLQGDIIKCLVLSKIQRYRLDCVVRKGKAAVSSNCQMVNGIISKDQVINLSVIVTVRS